MTFTTETGENAQATRVYRPRSYFFHRRPDRHPIRAPIYGPSLGGQGYIPTTVYSSTREATENGPPAHTDTVDICGT